MSHLPAPSRPLTDSAATELSPQELERYQRHLIMPEIGLDGQKQLKAARVLIIGAGGLGSPAALYLAAAGIGTIGLVDHDVVDVTNLQRQILHSTPMIGKLKLESAYKRLEELNPHVHVQRHDVQLTSANALEILEEYDIIVDGTDNFPSRYLINDACVFLGKPLVYGSIFRFEGQVSVFDSSRGPCYRCLYPSPPPPGLMPSCEEGGVLGVLPGIVGTMQALEAMKCITGQGDLLVGRLLLFDALRMSFREMKLRKDPACPVCGERRTIHKLIDYEEFCGMKPHAGAGDTFQITPEELRKRLDAGENIFILDVREQFEYDAENIGGVLIPLNVLPQRLGELDSSREIVVHCRTGRRSAKAVEILKGNGFHKVKNLIGGIEAWRKLVSPS